MDFSASSQANKKARRFFQDGIRAGYKKVAAYVKNHGVPFQEVATVSVTQRQSPAQTPIIQKVNIVLSPSVCSVVMVFPAG
jgi:hypothetical protein